MALTDRAIRSLSPREQTYRQADGLGLYVEVAPTGSKLWRHKYRFGGKEKRIALGAFPEVGLAAARKARDSNRLLLQQGIDPSLERRKAKAAQKVSAENSFAAVANELIDKKEAEGRAEATISKARWFLKLVQPAIGSTPVDQVDPQSLLAALKTIETTGRRETARKTRSFASQVFRYAVVTGRAKFDPAALLVGALVAPKVTHRAAIFDSDLLGSLLCSIDKYGGEPGTVSALKIAPHVFLRPGELRLAEWNEIDLTGKTWTVPASRTKNRREHKFPFSDHVRDLLAAQFELSGPNGYVFPAFHTKRRPISENTLNGAFRRMGFGKEVISAHGLRATASTLLNETKLFSPDAIERALSHLDRNTIRAAYNRGSYWDERVQMAEWWSGYLEEQKLEAFESWSMSREQSQ